MRLMINRPSKQIEDFTLRDYRGRERSLKEFEGKPVAVIFVGADCETNRIRSNVR